MQRSNKSQWGQVLTMELTTLTALNQALAIELHSGFKYSYETNLKFPTPQPQRTTSITRRG